MAKGCGRLMSFMLTKQQVRDGTKDVTRRNGWGFAKPGDLLQAVEQAQGLGKGEHPVHIRQLYVISTRWERLDAITPEDVIREGFPGKTPEWFIQMYCDHNGRDGSQMVNRIEFGYVGSKEMDKELKAMAQDPDIQREYEAIRREEMDTTNRVTEASGTLLYNMPKRGGKTTIAKLMRRIEALEAENAALRQVIADIRKELLCIPDNPDPVYAGFNESFMTEPHKVLLLAKATMKMVRGMKRIIEESKGETS